MSNKYLHHAKYCNIVVERNMWYLSPAEIVIDFDSLIGQIGFGSKMIRLA